MEVEKKIKLSQYGAVDYVKLAILVLGFTIKRFMMWYRLETLDDKGKMIEVRHVQISCGTVMQALHSKEANRMRDYAKKRGYGFRCKREDDDEK